MTVTPNGLPNARASVDPKSNHSKRDLFIKAVVESFASIRDYRITVVTAGA
jgi:hypothetical protein